MIVKQCLECGKHFSCESRKSKYCVACKKIVSLRQTKASYHRKKVLNVQPRKPKTQEELERIKNKYKTKKLDEIIEKEMFAI